MKCWERSFGDSPEFGMDQLSQRSSSDGYRRRAPSTPTAGTKLDRFDYILFSVLNVCYNLVQVVPLAIAPNSLCWHQIVSLFCSLLAPFL